MSKSTFKNIVECTHLGSFIAASLGVIVLVNVLAMNLFFRVDLTEGNVYSLDRASKNLVNELDEIVTAKVFFSQDIPQLNFLGTYLQDILEEYRAHGAGNFAYDLIDPAASSEKKQEAVNLGIRPNQLQVRTSEGLSLRDVYMGMALFYEDKVEVIPQIVDTKFEYDVTSAIRKLTMKDRPRILFTTGNEEYGELNGYALAAKELRKLYELGQIDLETGGGALQANDIVIVGGPKTALSETEVYYLDQHLLRGGKAILFLEGLISGVTPQIAEHGLVKLLSGVAISTQPGLIIDHQQNFAQRVNMIFQRPVPWIPKIMGVEEHPITKGVASFYAPFASPMSLGAIPEGVEAAVFGQASDHAWAELNENQLLSGQVAQDETDRPGAIPVAIAVSGHFTSTFDASSRPRLATISHKETADTEGRLIVFSSAQMLHDDAVSTQPGNMNVVLNSLDWMALDEALISIRAKDVQVRELRELSAGQIAFTRYINILLMPLLVICFGLIWWHVRKTHKVTL